MAQTKKKSAGKTKKPAAKKMTKKEQEQLELALLERRMRRRQIAAVALVFVGVLLGILALVAGGAGTVYNSVHNFYLGVWGLSAYSFPVILLAFAFLLSRGNETDRPYFFLIWSCVLSLFVIAVVHVIRCGNLDSLEFGEQISFEYYNRETLGGVFGAFLGGLVYLICGMKALSAILLIVIALLVIFLLSRTTVERAFRAVARPVERVGGETVRRLREEREAARAARAQEEPDAEPEPVRRPPRGNTEETVRGRSERGGQTQQPRRRRPVPPTDEIDQPPFDGGRRAAPDNPDNLTHVRFTPTESERGGSRKGNRRFVIPEERTTHTPIGELRLGRDEDEKPPVSKQNGGEPQPAGGNASPEKSDAPVMPDIFATIDKMERASAQAAKGAAQEPEQQKLDPAEIAAAQREVAEEIGENAAEPEKEYLMPPFECLEASKTEQFVADRTELKATADKLIAALSSFNVGAEVVDIVPGPSVTRYELKPATGVKISKFTGLADDLALHLAAPAGIRIEAPIPNKAAIGIEVPNRERQAVHIRELLEAEEFRKAKSKLFVTLGRDIAGSGVYIDIAKMPHLLVAGTTGSGKSVCLNTMIVSILYNAKPSEVKLLLIDPKSVEFSVYANIPHLLVPVVSDPRKAAGALGWAVSEMLNRYNMFTSAGVKDLESYNRLCTLRDDLEPMPQIVIIIDELADLMSVAPSEVEEAIFRLAQMARAAGMHLILATQRPSVDVITGVIKANIPSRIALSVSSVFDSRTILDMGGAEKLLGKGDMLVNPIGRRKPIRVQGCFVSDEELERVTEFVKSQETSEYDENIQAEIDRQAVVEKKKKGEASGTVGALDGDDELITRAVEFITANPDSCSISALQRRLGMGFSKAGRLMDTLESMGIVGPQDGGKSRKVLISLEDWYQMRAQQTSSDSGNEDE